MKYLTNSGLSYFFNKIKAYLTSSTYLNSIGISNSDIDDIADDAGYSSGSLPASEDVFLTGDIIPNTDNSVDLGASSKNIKMIYTKGITINGAQFLPSDYIPKTGSNAISGSLVPATDNSIDIGSSAKNIKMFYTKGITINGTQFLPSNYIPRSGGAVLSGNDYSRTVDDSVLHLNGSTMRNNGASIELYGKNHPSYGGWLAIRPQNNNNSNQMLMKPDGGWSWTGTACQITSDQRLKQQINAIDDKLLDAWEDVELSQFKYNDAVDQKKDKARLHTGYVVQQIDKACKEHGVDISKYGLYCHEEYPEETEEVEVEQADGTKTKERKVIREASEHYSLRYTEALIVECAYLRRENSRLKENLASLEERLEKLEKAENSKF